MQAVYLTLQPQPDQAAVYTALEGFEHKYPDQSDLLPQVVRLRLLAEQRLGKFAAAEADVKAHGPLILATLGATGVEDLAVGFIREGARRKNTEGPAVHKAAEQAALQLYELLVSDGEGAAKTKLTLARLYENSGELDRAAALYAEIQQGPKTSLTALRGLARIAEQQHKVPEAIGYWQQLTKTSRPGDAPWYEGQYQTARLTAASGRKAEACAQLEQLKPAMPGLSDIDLRKQLDELYKQQCG